MSGTARLGLASLALAGAAAGLAWLAWTPRGVTATASAGAPASTHAFWSAYRAAAAHRAAGNCETAISGYAEALAIRQDHEDSLYYLGGCLLERGDYDRAREAYRRLIAVNPAGSSRGYMQLALIHASLDPAAPGDLDQAAALFERALAVDQDSGALLGIGEVALLRGRLDDARSALERAHADNAMSVAAPYLLGYLAERRGDRDDAWRLFATAVGRGELKKPAVQWTEEGDVKADPALRWRALARQSVFGAEWLRLRALLPPHELTRADMTREYGRLALILETFRRDRVAAAPRP